MIAPSGVILPRRHDAAPISNPIYRFSHFNKAVLMRRLTSTSSHFIFLVISIFLSFIFNSIHSEIKKNIINNIFVSSHDGCKTNIIYADDNNKLFLKVLRFV